MNDIFDKEILQNEDGEELVREVSMMQATKEELEMLKFDLVDKKNIRNARDTGICPVRRSLFRDYFDELIRQVVLDSPERG
mmetsp:Transcript_30429/g.66404  ORF Transcript_30429/g.66404 Transcript_30429/m.66404 type:complete len:81 (+) Transcript_30429:185-427(+)|eukprot:CAMPEP_0116910280 /NCGR_PEP_ID=MMETSP0467-20121206/14781_1 /TAXON_ID=283647 /ORGANISM="Mesodinium pulex, Strain SPMC105" /LENGTH=80 /DNA_ID=CAMNT_0004585807 /DNA_START=168 /DNA_END=410 /DNA_ORIENTATION=-